jgi:hypothetical protein
VAAEVAQVEEDAERRRFELETAERLATEMGMPALAALAAAERTDR